MALDKVTTAVITDDAVTGAKIENNPTVAGNLTVAGTSTLTGNVTVAGDVIPSAPLSHRNVFINGAMQISQRYGTSVHTPSHPGFGLDRYKIHYSGGPVFSSQQVTDVPAGKGFTHSAKYTVTTADATATSTDQAYVKIPLEGHDWARFCYGTSSAKTTTLSFYVKSSVAGVYSIAYKNGSNNRSYSQVYTITSANTWERISITIPGDTSGTWAIDNGIGCSVSFDLGSGSGRYQTAGSWGTGNIDGATSAGADTWINTSGATFYITGVQLELGSNATPFEHRSYADELRMCQRYAVRFGGVTAYDWLGTGGYNTAAVKCHVTLPQMMRAEPIAESVNVVTRWAASTDAAAGNAISAISKAGSVHDLNHITLDVYFSGGSNGDTWQVSGNNNTSAKIIIAAEL